MSGALRFEGRGSGWAIVRWQPADHQVDDNGDRHAWQGGAFVHESLKTFQAAPDRTARGAAIFKPVHARLMAAEAFGHLQLGPFQVGAKRRRVAHERINAKCIGYVNACCIGTHRIALSMSEAHERLAAARRAAGYATAADAARAIGLTPTTYVGHENGQRGFARSAERYARFFRVSLDWIISGKGQMRAQAAMSLPLAGFVGTGGEVAFVESDDQVTGEVGMFDMRWSAVLEVRGDSQYPRYQDGEFVVFDTRKRDPSDLVRRYAVVHTDTDHRMIKILHRSDTPGLWRLDSHNAPPMDRVTVTAAFAITGTLSR